MDAASTPHIVPPLATIPVRAVSPVRRQIIADVLYVVRDIGIARARAGLADAREATCTSCGIANGCIPEFTLVISGEQAHPVVAAQGLDFRWQPAPRAAPRGKEEIVIDSTQCDVLTRRLTNSTMRRGAGKTIAAGGAGRGLTGAGLGGALAANKKSPHARCKKNDERQGVLDASNPAVRTAATR